MLPAHSIRRLLQASSLALSLGLAGTASAQSVTVGVLNTNNCIPFSCSSSFGTRYQQVYAAGAFAASNGPILINGIAFFGTLGSAAGVVMPGNYTIRFSTTSKAVDGLSTTFAANIGANEATFFSGAFAGGLSLAGTPFLYDPSAGNLLMDVTVNSQTYANTYLDASNYPGDATSRVYQHNADVVADGLGLITRFDFTPTTTVPEPSSVALVAAGLAAVAVAARRRRVTAAR